MVSFWKSGQLVSEGAIHKTHNIHELIGIEYLDSNSQAAKNLCLRLYDLRHLQA